MASGNMEIKLHSAGDLYKPNYFSKPRPYAVVWISNDYKNRKETPMDEVNRTNPIWDEVMNFKLDEAALQQDPLDLEIVIYTKATRKDKEMGRVSIPLNELLKHATTSEHFHKYQVKNPSGEDQGIIKLSVKLAEKPDCKPEAVAGSYGADKAEPETAYPKGSGGASNAAQRPPRKNKALGINFGTAIFGEALEAFIAKATEGFDDGDA